MNSDSERSILVIDDDPDDLFLLTHRLAKVTSHRVRAFPDGTQAIAWLYRCLADNPAALPAAVFTAMQIVGCDGFEVVKKIRSCPGFKDLPLIVISGWDRSGDRQRALRLGADHFAAKFPSERQLAEFLGPLADLGQAAA